MVETTSRAFLTPLLANSRRLREMGIELRTFTAPTPALADCDVLMIHAKYFGQQWNDGADPILAQLSEWSDQTGAIIYVDMYDSSGLIRAAVLPTVTLYAKNFLLRDRAAYAQPHYGGRIFTHYYHTADSVEDGDPQYSVPIEDPRDRAKLRVGWNTAFAHHGPLNYRVASLYRYAPLKLLLHAPTRFYSPSAPRSIDVSCRMSTAYARETVAYQRVRLNEMMSRRTQTGRLPRSEYFREMTRCKVVLSPFGWGEHAMRDYEAFVCGSVLLKPDMSHLETYPPLYVDGVTMVAHDWDLGDVEEKLDGILQDYPSAVEIAIAGQDLFRSYVSAGERSDSFVHHFSGLIRDATAAASGSIPH